MLLKQFLQIRAIHNKIVRQKKFSINSILKAFIFGLQTAHKRTFFFVLGGGVRYVELLGELEIGVFKGIGPDQRSIQGNFVDRRRTSLDLERTGQDTDGLGPVQNVPNQRPNLDFWSLNANHQ